MENPWKTHGKPMENPWLTIVEIMEKTLDGWDLKSVVPLFGLARNQQMMLGLQWVMDL